MKNMDHSMAQSKAAVGAFVSSAWKHHASTVSAVLLACLFLVAGGWKMTDPFGAATRMTQALVPGSLSLVAAIAFGIAEAVAALFLIVPRFRRWGAWLAGALLVAFMVYFAINYEALRGAECSCFPWIKRAVGPAFFYADGAMLALAVIAGVWAKPSEDVRYASMIAGAVSVFALVCWGVMEARQTGTKAPDSITVDGKPFSLSHGRVFLYFFDPECSHCDAAAREMAKHNWGATRVLGVATRMPQFSREFMDSTGLRAPVSSDLELLRKTFPFTDPPYAVVLEHGRQKAALSRFDETEPTATLRKLEIIQ
jgi:uncharacterized membrane protein YphA (DoxX/SURF4 family)